MTGLLFLLNLICVVLVAWWAYANDAPGGGVRGLLAMKAPGEDPAAGRGPRWRARRSSDGGAGPVSRAVPRWRRSAAAGR
jgi:hypothetical protein